MNNLLLSATGLIPSVMQLLVTLGTVFIGWWAVKKNRENPDRDIIREFFSGDIVFKLEIVAFFTTASECVGLSILAIGRDVDVFNAISRFVIFCGFEVATIYFFIMYSSKAQQWIVSTMIKNFFDDGKIDFKEILIAIVVLLFYVAFAVLLFPFFCIPTLIISYLYLESCGAIVITFGEISWYPWELISMSKNPEKVFTFIELGAFGVIWFTPGITAFQIIFTPFELIGKEYNKVKSKKSKDRDDSSPTKKKKKKSKWDDDDDDENDTWSSTSDDKIKEAFEGVSEIASISIQKLESNFKTLVGGEGKTPGNASIRNGTKTVDEFKDEVYNLLMGDDKKSDPQGILGYRKMKQLIEAESKTNLNTKAQEISTQEAIVKTSSGTKKSDAEDKVKRLKQDKTTILKTIQDYKSKISTIEDELKDRLKDIGLWP